MQSILDVTLKMSIVTVFPRETGLEQWLCIMKGSYKIWLLWLVVVQVWLSACWRCWGHSTISFKSFMTHWGPEGFWGIWWSSDYIILKETEAWQYWKTVTSTTITGIDTQQQEDGQAFDFVFPSHLYLCQQKMMPIVQKDPSWKFPHRLILRHGS